MSEKHEIRFEDWYANFCKTQALYNELEYYEEQQSRSNVEESHQAHEEDQSFVLLVFHSVVKQEIYSHRKNISSNHLFSDFFSKNVAFTKFLPKKCESKFL